uniref:Uncharacterized protein n=1 Tax=Vespula pensylvanica TaxID=30213 RepID=A0A834MZ78_VESPE|nr:hypothetical protein H0235_017704 [Vespula pensylvanica]
MSEDGTEKDIKRLEGRKLIPRLTGEGFNRVSRLSKVVVDEAKAQENGGVEADPEAEASATDSIKCDVDISDRQVKMEREGSLRHPIIKSILCSRQSLSGIGGTRIRAQVGNDREKSFESSIKISNMLRYDDDDDDEDDDDDDDDVDVDEDEDKRNKTVRRCEKRSWVNALPSDSRMLIFKAIPERRSKSGDQKHGRWSAAVGYLGAFTTRANTHFSGGSIRRYASNKPLIARDSSSRQQSL